MAEGLTYLSVHKMANLERRAKYVIARGIAGDFLEFGVALGGSAIVLAEKASKAGRAFAGFDVFAMIPPPVSEKDDEKSKARYEVIASGQATGIGDGKYYGYEEDLLAKVKDNFRRHGLSVDQKRISLIQGLFEETWPTNASDQVAFAHVDCDWYDPVRYCLEQVSSRLAPGGVILLDDYYNYGGCRVATDEFLAANPGFRLEDGPNPAVVRIA